MWYIATENSCLFLSPTNSQSCFSPTTTNNTSSNLKDWIGFIADDSQNYIEYVAIGEYQQQAYLTLVMVWV